MEQNAAYGHSSSSLHCGCKDHLYSGIKTTRENKFKHAGTEEMSLGPGSWRKCSLKERKGHLDKSDGLGEGGGTGAVQVWETWC